VPRQHSLRPDERLIIGITGRIGAGKTSVGKYIESRYGFFYVRYSQVLSEWMAQDPDSKTHLQAVGWKVMAGGMQQGLNDRVIARLESRGDCVVDGLRHPLDFENLSTTFPSQFRLLCVESPASMRWQRLMPRYHAVEAFQSADSHPVEQQIDSLCESAFAALKNNGTLDELYLGVDEVMKRIRPGGQP